jgi:hypothetical protein
VRLLADEAVDAAVVARLRSDGHDVTYVAELTPGVTDFGELVFRRRRVAAGVILVRLASLPSQARAETVARVVADHGERLSEAFSVVSPGAVRIRASARQSTTAEDEP